MLPRYTKPRTAHLTPQPITKQQVLDAAAHWRRMADDHAAFADSELDAADGGDAVKTDEEREKTPAYIVLCPTCQQMIGAHVDDGEHKRDLSRFIAKHIKAGYTVERKTVLDARNAEWCTCERAL